MLVVEQLQFAFPVRPLFQDLSFQIAPGQLMQLRGPNGSGKTTLMSLMAGLLRPHGGKIFLREGATIKSTRGEVAYLPAEGNGWFGRMDAVSNLRFWSRLGGRTVDDKALHDAARNWGIPEMVLRRALPVEKFSTGMKRRLSFARLELAQQTAWLLDEPLSGLDTIGIQQFQNLLGKHLAQGGLAAYISHDEPSFLPFQPHQVVLKLGEL